LGFGNFDFEVAVHMVEVDIDFFYTSLDKLEADNQDQCNYPTLVFSNPKHLFLSPHY
jgi:hypothetical protein